MNVVRTAGVGAIVLLAALLIRDERRGTAQDAPRAAAPPAAPGAPAAKPEPDAGWIGLKLAAAKDGRGAEVADVFPGSPAAFAGLRKQDVVVKIAGQPVAGVDAAAKAVEQAAPGTKLKVDALRLGRTLSVSVEVGSLAAFHRAYHAEMLRRDPRDPNYSRFPGIAAHDLQIESQRRLFEQNRRIETTLHDVLDELQALRAEVKELREKSAARPAK